MTSLVLQTATRALQPLMLFMSLFLLLRGHDEPGGGFVGGLVAAAAFGLRSMAFGPEAARSSVRVDPGTLLASGVLVALSAATLPLFFGAPFFDAMWIELSIPGVGLVEVGSPFVFDVGVYLIVTGMALSVVFALEEE